MDKLSDTKLSSKLFTTLEVPNMVNRLAEVGAVLEVALGKLTLEKGLAEGLSLAAEC